MLVELDTRQERAQLAAAEAQRDLARTNFDRMQGLLKDNVISRAEYDSATADDKQTEARAGEIRAAIQRKRITAPFSGILGIRQVNVGQYLSSGDPIVQLQSLNPIYVNFDVPQQATSQMRNGRDVRITTDDLGRRASSTAASRPSTRSSIQSTRNIQVQATLANPEGRLRPGMFVQAEVVLGSGRSVMALPATAISYAPYGDSVFVVVESERAERRVVSRRAPAVRQARGSARRSGRRRLGREAGRRGRHVRGVQAAQRRAVLVNNKVQPGEQPGAEAGGQLTQDGTG